MTVTVRCTYMDKHNNDEQAPGLPIPVVGELYTVPFDSGTGSAHYRVLERERHYGLKGDSRLNYTIWVERV